MSATFSLPLADVPVAELYERPAALWPRPSHLKPRFVLRRGLWFCFLGTTVGYSLTTAGAWEQFIRMHTLNASSLGSARH